MHLLNCKFCVEGRGDEASTSTGITKVKASFKPPASTIKTGQTTTIPANEEGPAGDGPPPAKKKKCMSKAERIAAILNTEDSDNDDDDDGDDNSGVAVPVGLPVRSQKSEYLFTNLNFKNCETYETL